MTDDSFCHSIGLIKERLDRIDARLQNIEVKQENFTKRFIIIDTKQSLLDFIIKNWWKIGIVLIPFLFFLGEISLHVRKLVP